MKELLAYIKLFRLPFSLALLALIIGAVANGAMIATIKPLLDQYFSNGGGEPREQGKVDQIFAYQGKTLEWLEKQVKSWELDLGAFQEETSFDFENPLPWGILVLTIFSIQALFEFLGKYGLGRIGLQVVVAMRSKLMHHLTWLSLQEFHRLNTGDLISRIGNDVSRIQNAISVKMSEMVREAAVCLVSLVLVFLINWRLSLALFLLIPLVGGPIVWLSKKIRRYASKSQTVLGTMTALFKETLMGIQIVKGFAKEHQELMKLDHHNHQYLRFSLKELLVVTATTPVLGLVGVSIMLAFLMMGSVIVQTTEMTQGDFMVFVLLVYQLYQPIKRMARANAEIQQAVGVLPRIHEVFSWENSIPESPNPQRPKSFPHLSRIVFDQVGFSYLSGQPILNQISFEVQQGQTVALVGPSGGGKTTLLQLLPRFYDCTSGRILFDDLDQKRMAKADLRALFAMVTQDTVLFSDTVHNNIAYGQPELTRAAVEEAAVQANAHSFIQELPHGYDTVLGEGGSGLSGGQRQRIAIARAILKNAPVLILDEATSALDTESETEVQIALERLMGSKTAFVIAHRLSTVRKADLILVLEKGAIVERGTHQELLNRQGLYAKLHTLQQEPTTK